MTRFSGKVALVTGGSRGIGEATVRLLVEEGAQVVISDVLVAEGEALSAGLGDAAIFVEHDVRSETGWETTVRTAVDHFGRLDILVNNAGVVRFGTSTQDCSLEDYRWVIEVNQVGVFLGMRSVVPALTSAGGGAIVNVSSVAGLVGSPGLLPYVASKFAVTGMTKAAALDLAPLGIRVNSVHPGVIDTPIHDAASDEMKAATRTGAQMAAIGRMAAPREIAEMIAFAASGAASFSTGAAFVADGGWSAS